MPEHGHNDEAAKFNALQGDHGANCSAPRSTTACALTIFSDFTPAENQHEDHALRRAAI